MKEKWYFTFGSGQENDGHYVIVNGGFMNAREKMVKKYGIAWSGQYTMQQFYHMGLQDKLEFLEEL